MDNPRSETASHTQGTHSKDSHRVWGLGQNQEQGGPSGGWGWQLQAGRGKVGRLPGPSASLLAGLGVESLASHICFSLQPLEATVPGGREALL